MMVQRFRFFSATPDEPALWVRLPPNMSDSQPPLPLCMSISRVSSRAEQCGQAKQYESHWCSFRFAISARGLFFRSRV